MAKKAYIGVSYTPLSPTFSDNTWEQIIYACRNNCVPDTWVAGNQKSMTIGGTDYLIDIIGKNHDDYADGSGKAPLTFLMHGVLSDLYQFHSSDSNSCGWEKSLMRTTNVPAILKKMPKEVQDGIKAVNKLTVRGSTTTTTADTLFLLAEIEVLGYTSSSANGEGMQYAYFANGGSQEKYSPDGTRQAWWWRSVPTSSSTSFMNGWMKNSFGSRPASNYAGVAVAFCFGGTSSPSSAARKIKKGYIGIGNVARKIKKAYIGIGGVARPCWSGGELAYYGTITALNTARYSLAATSVGNYALFGGGYTTKSVSTVDAYNDSLTRTDATSLSKARYQFAATSIASYALFGGGLGTSSTDARTEVDAYNTSITRQSVSNGIWYSRYDLAASSVGNIAFFGGGRNSNGALNYVSAFDSSLSYTNANQLTNTKFQLAATTVGDYALFGGGFYSSNYYATVDALNTSYTRTQITALSVGRYSLAATTVGDYALFGGGLVNSGASAAVDVYNASLTRTTTLSLSVGRYRLNATTVGNYAVFGGGTGNTSAETTVDAFDSSLVRTTMPALSAKQRDQAATSIGNYALFGGGCGANGNERLSTVYAYTIA